MALETGACVCGNRLFMQMTCVYLDSDTSTFEDTSGRKKKLSERVFKIYECCLCKKRYLYNAQEDEWRNN